MLEAPVATVLIITFLVAFVLVYMDFSTKKENFMQDISPPYAPIHTSEEEELDLGLRIPTMSELPCKPECCHNGYGGYSCSRGCVCAPHHHVKPVEKQIQQFPFYMPRRGIYVGDRFGVWSDCFDPEGKKKPQNVVE